MKEIDATAAAGELAGPKPPVLIDVRDADEHGSGCISGAVLVPLPAIAARITGLVPDRDAPVIAYCASGVRSAQAVGTLIELGYRNVRSLRGGFAEWRRSGLAWLLPDSAGNAPLLTTGQAARYARHLSLPEVGVTGQRRLLEARILCVGAGGLGSPASLYLAAAGVGHLGIVDNDVVELSNLQRQILHTTARVGLAKVDSAGQALSAINSDVEVVGIGERLVPENAATILAGYDVIIDGSDNMATRYLVNDTALRLGKPVVHAAIHRFEGQLTVFAGTGAPCYRCIFPEPPPADAAPSCQEAGVLGVLPGVLGLLQATEAIKIVLGIGDTLVGRLLTYDALSLRFSEVRLRPDPRCTACSPGRRA